MRQVPAEQRVYDLEQELESMKLAFDGFVASSKKLEQGLDKELIHMSKYKIYVWWKRKRSFLIDMSSHIR